jgi:LexA-binding, inner membrane-associated putative hydrolase
MSNRTEHVQAGMFTGAVYAGFRARHQRPEHMLAEALGGILGGAAGSILPDVIDPPSHPNHRHIAHGAVNVGLVLWGTAAAASNLQGQLREQADAIEAQRPYLTTNADIILSVLHEYALRVLAGSVNGVPAGYVSHLVLDAGTAKGINLFARGC